MIQINPINNIFSRLVCDDEEQLRDIYNFFRIEDPSLKYTPAVRSGMSDGKKSFVSTSGQFAYGLKQKIIKYIKSKEWEYQDNIPSVQERISDDEWNEFIQSVDLPFEPYDYQMNGARIAVEEKRRILLASTSAGKSLMLYLMIRWFIYKGLNTLIVVPSVDLVNQLYSDFEEYTYLLENQLRSERPLADEMRQYEIDARIAVIEQNRKKHFIDGDFDEIFHKIFAGQDKTKDVPVVISTFQSIYDIGPSGFFMRFDVMLADETHRAKADSYVEISKYLDVQWKIGVSGTLPPNLIDQLVLEGTIGQAVNIISPKELIERGLATPTHIQPVFLKYSADTVKQLHKATWQEESKFFRYHQGRIEFLARFGIKLASKGNTIILIKNVDLQKAIYEEIKKTYDKVFLISGSVKSDERERVRKGMDTMENVVVVASSQIMATGISIKSLKYVVFGQFTSAEIQAIQAIGRALRLYDGKDESVVYDICDYAPHFSRTGREYPNYALKHFRERLNSYVKYEYLVKDIVKIQLEQDGLF